MDDHTSTNRPHNAPSYDCVYGIWYVMFEFRFLAKNVWQQNGTENMTFLLLPSCPLLTNLSHNESNYSKCFLLSMFQLMYSFLCWTLADRSERSVKTNGIFSPPKLSVNKQVTLASSTNTEQLLLIVPLCACIRLQKLPQLVSQWFLVSCI